MPQREGSEEIEIVVIRQTSKKGLLLTAFTGDPLSGAIPCAVTTLDCGAIEFQGSKDFQPPRVMPIIKTFKEYKY